MTTLIRAMIDTACRLRVEQSGAWVEGQRATQETPGDPFPCLLTVASTSESGTAETFRARLLYPPLVELDTDDRVQIDSSALGQATWMVAAPPTVMRRSRRVVAREADLLRVEGL